MNNNWARNAVKTGAVVAGAAVIAGTTSGMAMAYGSDVSTSDQIGALSGNQIVAPVQAPINICGIAAAVLGGADAGCEGGSSANFNGPTGDLTTSNNYGTANGNQLYSPIQAPIDVSSIGAAVGGTASAYSQGGSDANIAESGHVTESGNHHGSDVTTMDNTGALSGNQLLAPIQAPIDVCGNAISVAGSSAAGCEGGASATLDGPTGDLTTSGNTGLGNGNQAWAPIQAPVNVCGNAIAIFGTATASCTGGSDAEINPPADDHHKKGGHKESASVESVDTVEAAAGNVQETAGGLLSNVPVAGTLVGAITSKF